jgi:hypothetical protein
MYVPDGSAVGTSPAATEITLESNPRFAETRIPHARLSITGVSDALRIDGPDLYVNHPFAIHALIEALQELLANPHGAAMLAAITPGMKEE